VTSAGPAQARRHSTRRAELFSHATHPQNAKLLISPAYRCQPPGRVVRSVDFRAVYTHDLHRIKTRRIIKCGATYRFILQVTV
jgi:hypothetical protein